MPASPRASYVTSEPGRFNNLNPGSAHTERIFHLDLTYFQKGAPGFESPPGLESYQGARRTNELTKRV